MTRKTFRYVSEQWGLSLAALVRHRDDHLPADLLRAAGNREVVRQVNVLEELTRCSERVTLLSDACDRWLRDPADPERYDVGPRAEDVQVTYTVPGEGGRPARKKEALSVLLARVEARQPGLIVEKGEYKHADPRELLLKAYDRLESRLTLVAKLLGELAHTGTVNVVLSPEWLALRGRLLTALSPFPEAREAVVTALNGAGSEPA